MRTLLLIAVLCWASVSRAECDRPLATTLDMNYRELQSTSAEHLAKPKPSRLMKAVRGLAVGASALALANVADPVPARAQSGATPFFTLPEVERTLKDQGLSNEDANRVLGAIKKFDPENKLPITGMLNTSGLSLSFFLGEGTWPNVTTSFKDERSSRVLSSNCLYDMYYSNSGIVASLGYKWVIMILVGDANVSDLNGAVYGRGIGLTIDTLLGLDIQYLPQNNRPSGMFVISPQVGVGAGIRFPKIEFSPAQSCSAW